MCMYMYMYMYTTDAHSTAANRLTCLHHLSLFLYVGGARCGYLRDDEGTSPSTTGSWTVWRHHVHSTKRVKQV